MNLFFRLLYTLLTSRWRSRCDLLSPCITPFRCLPNDLDVLRHMNNSRYFALMDLARVDLMIRTGFYAKLKKLAWYPVVVAETIRFRKSIELFDRFDIETTIIGWDDKAIILQQRFIRNGQAISEAIVRARFLKKSGGAVTIPELRAAVGIYIPSPALPDWVQRWNEQQTL